MATLQYGPLCPEGHGILVDSAEWQKQGVIWCPNAEHGGNGRFYRVQEVESGTYNPDAPRVKSEWQLAKEKEAAERTADRQEYEMAKKDAAAEAAVEAKAPRVRKAKEPKECKCGCGGMTKGGTFLPGHDARYHAALAKEEAAKAAAQATE